MNILFIGELFYLGGVIDMKILVFKMPKFLGNIIRKVFRMD